jgi:hypothetical protein
MRVYTFTEATGANAGGPLTVELERLLYIRPITYRERGSGAAEGTMGTMLIFGAALTPIVREEWKTVKAIWRGEKEMLFNKE